MSNMRRIALGLEYAGEAFSGWQSQREVRTVQDTLEAALASIAGEAVRLHCAGRTDAGVHATAQVAHFDTHAVRGAQAWVRGANSLLPPEIAVHWAHELAPEDDFHARFCAECRHYRYLLLDAPVRPALLARRVGWFHQRLNVTAMQTAAQALVGEHDFSAFRAAGCQAKSPVKILHQLDISRQGALIVFDLAANGFLHHMVRNLVGALVYVGAGRTAPEQPARVLASRERRLSAPTFAADGLYFCGVRYPARFALPHGGHWFVPPALPVPEVLP